MAPFLIQRLRLVPDLTRSHRRKVEVRERGLVRFGLAGADRERPGAHGVAGPGLRSRRIEEEAGRIGQRLDFFFQAEDGIRDVAVTGVQTCALPISIGMSLVGSKPHQLPVQASIQAWLSPTTVSPTEAFGLVWRYPET